MKNIIICCLLSLGSLISFGQTYQFPVQGLCIAAPRSDDVDRFVKFIDEELATVGVNTLILRIDFNYQYQSRPELADEDALSRSDIEKIRSVCALHEIELIPQINLLGHQSWAEETTNLLTVYPQFDETPHVKMPEEYEWPNEDGLYCKSYCPLHPEVHEVVFDLVDEIMEVTGASAFHAGMDEVFYLADEKCPRCAGKNKAELFANEVTKIRDHLAADGRRLWIWGDRLIDGDLTGLGMWEASTNDTHPAVDLIPKDVVICDWHYERPDATAAYFAIKGFDVITCSWRNEEVTLAQAELTQSLIEGATDKMRSRYRGMIHTIWSGASGFMDRYYDFKESQNKERDPVNAFIELFKVLGE